MAGRRRDALRGLTKLRRFLSFGTAPEQTKRESRPLRLGVDYGTSRSKLVITDYGAVDGERSFVVRHPEYGDEYRIPSSICAIEDSLRFGFTAEALADRVPVYRSLKMLCAYPDRFYGDHVPLPSGLSARDLATLYVGHLIHIGRDAAVRYAHRFQAEPSLGMTLGMPMAQIDDEQLHKMFVNIAREAFGLVQRLDLHSAVSIPDAKGALADVRAELAGTCPDQPRDWVRSEAEAALFWAHRSPDIGAGRFACVDVGAGTTSASWFHISATRTSDVLVSGRLSFYGAACAPPACDAVDQVLAKHMDGATNLGDIRAREIQLIENLPDQGEDALKEILSKIAGVFGSASGRAFEKERSVRAWKHIGRVFFLGGGTKLPVVCDRLIEKKHDWLLRSDAIADPGVPSDLTEEDGTELRADPTFLLVAYGLARRLGDVPDTFTPGQIDNYTPGRPTRDRTSFDDLYSD